MSELAIRHLGAEELDLVEPLWDSLRQHHAAVTPELGPPRSRADSWRRRSAQYRTWLSASADSFLLLAERHLQPVGYAMVRTREGTPTWAWDERVGELETLAVLPRERGAGVGSDLLRAVQDELRVRGIAEISLHAVPTNRDAIRFYERHGFGTFGLMLTRRRG